MLYICITTALHKCLEILMPPTAYAIKTFVRELSPKLSFHNVVWLKSNEYVITIRRNKLFPFLLFSSKNSSPPVLSISERSYLKVAFYPLVKRIPCPIRQPHTHSLSIFAYLTKQKNSYQKHVQTRLTLREMKIIIKPSYTTRLTVEQTNSRKNKG